MALGSRLRLLTAKVTEDAARIYKLYDVDLAPKWFPVFFILAEEGENTISEIANKIGHSQPSVSKIIREMTAAGLILENRKTDDKRRNVVALTKKGRMLGVKIKDQYADVNAAIDALISTAQHNLWEAMEEWEFLLDQQPLYKRVIEQKKIRESKDVTIVKYNAVYHTAFKTLNEEWISTYFELEEADRQALENPDQYILNPGGKIFVALYRGEPVGVCALIKMNDPDYDYELAKMAVSPKAQGKNIGYLLGQSAINEARKIGAKALYLESNTILKPAINLYYKLGFQKITGHVSPYKRCNIQMSLICA
ncbi:bifunctional helix-turn-helix transcriptional regulator/GNAT family N-acetyltransferase [Olivibacter jilunii]|uniref:bifunctional helix-turn-helix transcriptional regulator/GNAT family N-acetyltransferase n=1 Tax=Olivibacter jilunii TaxID=985016 RepID=UPI001F5F8AB4|nr:helix-turn-helix domain-containing GNAT family N-acetyltransferase [Olivibacter jilunii]